MEGFTAILEVLGTALDALVNLGEVGGNSRGLRGKTGTVITSLPPLPIPPVRATPQRVQKTS